MSGKTNPTDIVGKKIGKIKVLKLLPDKKVYKHSQRYQYECLCECGNTTIKIRDILIGKNANPMCEECAKEQRASKKGKDITEQKFGRLKVLEMTKERKHGKIVCKCQCDCGNVVYVTKDDLLWGGTKSCGCLKEENSHKPRPLKKIGDIVNNWELLELKETKKQKNNYIYLWHCKCVCCGEEKDIWSNNFATIKCKVRKEIDKTTLKKIKEDKLILPVPSNIEDITNEKFGKLKVLGFAGEVNYRYYWTCKCECGTIKVIRMDSLMNGSIVSCGCYHKEIAKKSIKDLTGQNLGN